MQEIWHIAPSPSDPLLLYTCYNTGIFTFTTYYYLIFKYFIYLNILLIILFVRGTWAGQNEFRASLWRIDDQTLVETSQLAHSETIKWCIALLTRHDMTRHT